MTGSFNPSPQVFGDSENTIWEIFLNALNQGDGDALNHDVDSFNYAENLAVSRALVDLWRTNRKLSYQFDPNLMTDFLSRWEEILNIVPDPGQSDIQRRNVIATKVSNYGKAPIQQVITDLLRAALGDVFVDIINSDYTVANMFIPGGAVVPGGATLMDGDWSSTTAYIAVLVVQPIDMSDNDFYRMVGNVDGLLEDVLPAWTSFNWVRESEDFGAGFYLDTEHNLDNQFFDV